MHTDDQLALYLRSISQGVSVNRLELQKRTELYYSKYLNEFYSPSKYVRDSFLDNDVFELALIVAFKEVIDEQLGGKFSEQEIRTSPLTQSDLIQPRQESYHPPGVGGLQRCDQIHQRAKGVHQIQKVSHIPPVHGGVQLGHQIQQGGHQLPPVHGQVPHLPSVQAGTQLYQQFQPGGPVLPPFLGQAPHLQPVQGYAHLQQGGNVLPPLCGQLPRVPQLPTVNGGLERGEHFQLGGNVLPPQRGGTKPQVPLLPDNVTSTVPCLSQRDLFFHDQKQQVGHQVPL